MPSRTKRKRYRLRTQATASSPKIAGGWGRGSPVTRGDLRLLRHAIREVWDVPEYVRELIVEDVMAVITDSAAKPRLQIAATWAIIEMARDNQRDILMWGRES
jgi:hypothetical protein